MRLQMEREYWDKAAADSDVDNKYICDFNVGQCIEELGEMSGAVLEIGCGVGRLMRKGYVGIDISEKMLKIAISRKPNCRFLVTDGDIPFPDKSFDSVYSMLVFQHIKPKQVYRYIREAHRVLKTDGLFKFQFVVGTEREPFCNYYTPEEMSGWLTEAGFNTIFTKPSNLHPTWLWMEGIK